MRQQGLNETFYEEATYLPVNANSDNQGNFLYEPNVQAEGQNQNLYSQPRNVQAEGQDQSLYNQPRNVPAQGQDIYSEISILKPSQELKKPLSGITDKNFDVKEATKLYRTQQLINKLDEIPLNAGDTVNVRCGDEFHGSVKLYNLQGDDENPIIFRSYNNGIKPLLSGNSRTDQSVLSFSNFKR